MKWFIGILVLFSTLYSDVTVVASDGKVVTANVSSKASRCDYYIFVDQNGKVIEVIENGHKEVRGGASSALVTLLKERKATHLIAASFGDKLVSALKSNNIKHTIATGSVKNAIGTLTK